jgi:cyclic pyranopterin phosphate synthase
LEVKYFHMSTLSATRFLKGEPMATVVDKKKFIAPFKMVEVEINTHCNRRCAYCPQGIPEYRQRGRFMSVETFRQILLVLKNAEYSGRLSYHFFNEPLLHPKIFEMVALAKELLPEAHQVIFTNGDLLTEEKFLKLRELGVFKVVVTAHSGKIHPEREGQINLTPKDLHLTNRGGKVLDKVSNLKAPCFAPSTMLIVGFNGDVILCYEDADRTTILGNLLETPLEEIWNAPLSVEVRTRLERGDRTVRPVCSGCNNMTHTTPIIYDLHP